MSIKFNVIERGQPGVAGGGKKKFYANAITDGESDIDDLTRQIEKISTVSGADIRAVLYSLVDVLPQTLSDGKIARMGDLGYFRISISSTGHEKEGDVNSSSVKNSKIIFTPGPKLKTMLNNLEYRKA